MLFSLSSVLFNTLRIIFLVVFVEFVVPSAVEVISPLVLSVGGAIFLPIFVAAVVVFLPALYETARKIVVVVVVVECGPPPSVDIRFERSLAVVLLP